MPLSKLAGCLVCLLMAVASQTSAFAQSLVVGGKSFTEQQLVAEITSQFLTAKGFRTRVRIGFSTSGIRKEQEAGLVDVYWEYTGTALVTFNNVREKLGPTEAYVRVKELDAPKGLIWLLPSRINNTYALAMRRAEAVAKGITSISELAVRIRQGERFRLDSNTEFFIRRTVSCHCRGPIDLSLARRMSSGWRRAPSTTPCGMAAPWTSGWCSRRMAA